VLDTAQSCEEKVIALLFGGRVPALTKLPKSCEKVWAKVMFMGNMGSHHGG